MTNRSGTARGSGSPAPKRSATLWPATGPSAVCAPPSPGRALPGWDYVLLGRHDVTAARAFPDLCADLAFAVDTLHAGRGRKAGPPKARGKGAAKGHGRGKGVAKP